jgi:hypothetical protein
MRDFVAVASDYFRGISIMLFQYGTVGPNNSKLLVYDHKFIVKAVCNCLPALARTIDAWINEAGLKTFLLPHP